MRSVIGAMHGDVDRTRELATMRASVDHLPMADRLSVALMLSNIRPTIRHQPDLGIVALQLLSLEMLVEWDPATKQPREPVSGESGQDLDTSPTAGVPPSPASSS